MIVLTGGAGFIGSCFLRKLNDMNITDILVVDHLSSGLKWKNLVGKRFANYINKNDFRKRLAAGDYSGRIEAIVHLGACSSTTETDADYLFDNNLTYSKELAEYALGKNIRFIYASSAATYGDGVQGYSDNDIYNLRPLNCYGLTKQLFDMWVMDNGLESKLTGIKFFNVFGPNEYHKGDMASMVYKSFGQAMNTGKIKLFQSYNDSYNDGEQKRDFIYVKDVVNILWQMYADPNFVGIYNLGTGHSHSWNELALAVFKALKMPPVIEYVEMPEKLKHQYQYFTEADMTKLSETGSDYVYTELDDAVDDYINGYLKMEFPFF